MLFEIWGKESFCDSRLMWLYMRFLWSPCSLSISSQGGCGRLNTPGCFTISSEGWDKTEVQAVGQLIQMREYHVPVCSSLLPLWTGGALELLGKGGERKTNQRFCIREKRSDENNQELVGKMLSETRREAKGESSWASHTERVSAH